MSVHTHTHAPTRTHTHTYVCSAPRLVPSRLCFWTHENDSLRKDGSPELPPHLLLEQKYLIEGLVGVRVAEAERGFLPELFSELMLLELREDHVRCRGSPAQGPATVGAAPRPRPPGHGTSNCWHFRLRMLTSLACRGDTFCFTWMASFLVFAHCSGSSCAGRGQGPLPFLLFLKPFYCEITTDSRGDAKISQGGASLVVQWLRLCERQGAWAQSLGRELGPTCHNRRCWVLQLRPSAAK